MNSDRRVGIFSTVSLFLAALLVFLTGFAAGRVEAAISYVGASSAYSGGSTASSLTLTVPAGTVAGDFLLVEVGIRGGSGSTITPPAGWTQLSLANSGTTLRQGVYYRIVQSGDPDSYVFSMTSARVVAAMVAFRGVDAVAPVNASSTPYVTNPGDIYPYARSVTTDVSDAWLVGVFSTAVVTSFTPPSGMTERVDMSNQGGGTNGVTIEITTEIESAAGASGTRTAITANSAQNIGMLLALKPAAVLRADYHFDECAYTGAAGEVRDSYGSNHATARNALSTSVPGQVQRMGNFDTYAKWAETSIALANDWSLSVWFKKPFVTGNAQYYVLASLDGGGDLFGIDSDNSWRWFVYDSGAGNNSGTLRFSSLSDGWHHLVVVGKGNTTRIYVDGTYRESVSVKEGGTLRYLGTSYDYVNGGSAQGIRAPLDEFMVWDHVLNDNQIAAIYANQLAGSNYDGSTRGTIVCGLDHIRLLHTGQGVTCSPAPVEVVACANADCSLRVTAAGVSVTLTGIANASWATNPVSTDPGTGSVTAYLRKPDTSQSPNPVTLGVNASSPASASAARCFNGLTETCSLTFSDSGFLFNVPDHRSETSTTVKLSAVRKSDNSLVCVPAFASVNKSVKFTCAYANPATGSLPVRVAGYALNAGNSASSACDGTGQTLPLGFDTNGEANIAVLYADAGKMTLNASHVDTGLVMTGTDTFIAAPADFAFGAIASPIAAGTSFTATVTARNSAGNPTPNFGKESSPEKATVSHVKYQPTGADSSDGTLTASLGAFNAGSATATLAWSEVGTIDLKATLDNTSGYLGSGLGVTGTTGSTGALRFYPHHFDTVVTPESGCAGFAYSRQPFKVEVTARSFGNGVTRNYYAPGSGGFAKAVSLTEDGGAAGSLYVGTTAGGTNAVPAASFASGVGTVLTTAASPVSFRFTSEPSAKATIKVHAEDADTMPSKATHGGSNGSIDIYSGRLWLGNAYGSELLPLKLPIQAQYWVNNAWQQNTLDSCTLLTVPTAANGGLLFAAQTVRNQLASGETAAQMGGGGTLVKGDAQCILSKPGAGNSGYVDIVGAKLGAPAWLTQTGNGRACFGICGPRSHLIYRTERY